MSDVFIWKYTGGNYFNSGTTYVDKISLNGLPLNSFPVFNFITEEISGIAQYKAGDFDVRVIIDGGEISAGGNSINTFFRGGTRDYTYVVGIQMGAMQFWGFTTNEFIRYTYLTRIIDISCVTAETEAKNAISAYFIGTLDIDRTFDDFITNVFLPTNIINLNVQKAFSDYNTLISSSGVRFEANLWNSAAWVGTVNVWQQFVELMMGIGLNWKFIYRYSSINFNESYPPFSIYIFSLEHLTASTIPLKIIEASDYNIFRKLRWLYIRYRQEDSADKVDDGIVSDGSITYSVDVHRFTGIERPFFSFEDDNGTVTNILWLYLGPGTPAPIKVGTKDADLNMLDLPVYGQEILPTPMQSIPIARSLHKGNYGQPNSNNGFKAVQDYTMIQYKRYIGGLQKRCKEIKIMLDETSDFDLWKTVSLTAEGETLTYYISEMNDINLAERTMRLLLIQTT